MMMMMMMMMDNDDDDDEEDPRGAFCLLDMFVLTCLRAVPTMCVAGSTKSQQLPASLFSSTLRATSCRVKGYVGLDGIAASL